MNAFRDTFGRRGWHRHSIFGTGRRKALSADEKSVIRARLELHRRARTLTSSAERVGRALVRMVGADGRCDPSQQTIADTAGVSLRAVKRALRQLKDLGIVQWAMRIRRSGARVLQDTNAYVLSIGQTPESVVKTTGGQNGREMMKSVFKGRKSGGFVDSIASRDAQLAFLRGDPAPYQKLAAGRER